MKSALKFLLTVSFGLSLNVWSSTSAAAKDASDSTKGTIVVKLDPNARGIKYAKKLAFGSILGDSLVFYKFEGDESEALSGTAKGKGSKKKMPIYKTEDGYLSIDVKPGRYFLASVIHQTHWGSCLNSETILFDVKPNIATHIGTIDLSGTISALKSDIRISGDIKVKETDGIKHYYTDTNRPPKITLPNSMDLQEATESLKKKNLDFNSTVVSGSNRPFSFKKRVRKKGIINTGSTSVRKCGK